MKKETYQLFIGKVAGEIGFTKTAELLRECEEALKTEETTSKEPPEPLYHIKWGIDKEEQEEQICKGIMTKFEKVNNHIKPPEEEEGVIKPLFKVECIEGSHSFTKGEPYFVYGEDDCYYQVRREGGNFFWCDSKNFKRL